ncbi:MAG: hypothetical protein ACFE96_00010 [Candidatus Hermodarchaeota archaeon]
MEKKERSYNRVKCEHCGRIIVAPFHEDCRCRSCNQFSKELFRFLYEKKDIAEKVEFKDYKPLTSKSEKKSPVIQKKLYFYGIVSKTRIPIYYNDKKWKYFLELTNNLDVISTSTLSGTLDKMLITLSAEAELENEQILARFFEKNGFIHVLIGNFSDKDSYWLFNQVSMFFNDLILKYKNKLEKLDKIDKREISFKINIFMNKMEEAVELKVKFEKPNFNYIDNWLRLHYVGLSSESVGVISLLLDRENILKFGEQKFFEPDTESDISQKVEQIIDFSESVLTAKIEVILASILANMKGYPRWISIRSGFQKYRFLSFKRLENNFFLYCITEGNLEKLETLESFLYLYMKEKVSKKFTGSLHDYNEIKTKIKSIMEPFPERKFY